MMCRITGADSQPVIINDEEKEKDIDKKRGKCYTGNIIQSYKELSSLHYLRKDNRVILPLVSNAQFADCISFYKQVNALKLYTRLHYIEIIYINMKFIFSFLKVSQNENIFLLKTNDRISSKTNIRMFFLQKKKNSKYKLKCNIIQIERRRTHIDTYKNPRERKRKRDEELK